MSVGWLRACALVMLGLFSVSALAKDKTAIVIGGGVSGLTAAYELQKKGWQVTLLEAKPSLGGRSGMATSEWIGNDKTQPVLNKYISTFKLSTTPAPEFVRTPGYLIDGVYNFNFASYIESIRAEGVVERAHIERVWGKTGLHDQSHGQSLINLFRRRLGSERRAIYLLDEPEAALSPKRQLEFLALLNDWAQSGNVQAIVATHSPIIMGFPDATLLSFDGGRIREVAYRDVDHYRLTLDFLADPEAGTARAIAAATADAAHQARKGKAQR